MEKLAQPENNRKKYYRLSAEAELALVEKYWGQAISTSQSLIEIFQVGGFRWSWARVLIRLGDALRQRGELGDLEQAREVYQQSLAMFTEMGAPGYIAALNSRLNDLE